MTSIKHIPTHRPVRQLVSCTLHGSRLGAIAVGELGIGGRKLKVRTGSDSDEELESYPGYDVTYIRKFKQVLRAAVAFSPSRLSTPRAEASAVVVVTSAIKPCGPSAATERAQRQRRG
jgi:hypothetical protein